jgi:sirohydrochlorin cobaltochelatase
MNPLSPETAVILIDHGSKEAKANAMLETMVRLYQAETGQRIVEAAHMSILAPTLEDAIERSISRGAHRIVVAPFFLAAGTHGGGDIPRMVRDAAARFPDVSIAVAEPLAPDPLLVKILHQRVLACVAAVGESGQDKTRESS